MIKKAIWLFTILIEKGRLLMSAASRYSVPLEQFVEEFDLENVVPEISLEGRVINSNGVNRPALQLA